MSMDQQYSQHMAIDAPGESEDISRVVAELQGVVRGINALGQAISRTEQSFINTQAILGRFGLGSQLSQEGKSAIHMMHEYLRDSAMGPFHEFANVNNAWPYLGGGELSPLLMVPGINRIGEPTSPSASDVELEPMTPPGTGDQLECPCTKTTSQETTPSRCSFTCRTVEELARHLSKSHPAFYLWECPGGKTWPELHRLKNHFSLARKAKTRCYCTNEICTQPTHDAELVSRANRNPKIKVINNKITSAQKKKGYRERSLVVAKRAVDKDLLMMLLQEKLPETELAAQCLTGWERVRVDFKYADGEEGSGES